MASQHEISRSKARPEARCSPTPEAHARHREAENHEQRTLLQRALPALGCVALDGADS